MNEQNVLEGKVIDTSFYSIGFPNENWDKLIKRDNYISQIEDFLKEEYKIIFLEGEEDIGKTTLCGQFARKNFKDTISIFFNPHNKLDLSLEFVYENIVGQVKFLLGKDEKEEEAYISLQDYRQYIFQLRKKIKRNSDKIYLVIDGLERFVNEEEEAVKKIFDIIPLGEDLFRMVISGSFNGFAKVFPKLNKMAVKSLSLSGFTRPEIIKYLNIEKPLEKEFEDLFKITKGYPGRLKTLNRLLRSNNYTLEEVIQSNSYKRWVEMDCEPVELNNSKTNTIISLLSFTDKIYTISEISRICSIPEEQVKSIIKELNILEYDGEMVVFSSSAHKKYFSTLLLGKKKDVEELLMLYLSNEDNINAKYELSKIHADKGQWQKVNSLIDENFVKNILESTGTLQKVNESLDLGVKASMEMKKYAETWRYSILGSIFNELDNYMFWESEVEARISIKDFSGAISLAESAVLKVDRLKLLALIARRQKELSDFVDEDLVNLINELYRTTDIATLGERIFDIVADLIYAIPNLAIEIIDKSKGNSSEKNINDWIIAKLSLAGIDSSLKDGDKNKKLEKLEAIENLNNPSVRKINRAISFLVGNYSSQKVLDEVNKLRDSEEKLKLLRLWLNNHNSKTESVEIVIETALEELIKSSSEAIVTLDILTELSYQLPYVKNRYKKQDLIKRFQIIEKDLTDLGLSKNKYVYRLNIFHAIFSVRYSNCFTEINNIINEIDKVDDLLVKIESYAEVYKKLIILKREDFRKIINFVHSRILSLAAQLYGTTANHYKISQYFLETISKVNPVLGLHICSQINTIRRREKARLLVLDAYLNNNLKFIKFELLKEIDDAFEMAESKRILLLRVLERYSESRSLHFKVIESLIYYIDKVSLIENASNKIIGLISALKIVAKNSTWKNRLLEKIKNRILQAWLSIEADWEKIDNGFIICGEVAQIEEEFSKDIFERTENIKNNSWIDSKLVAYTYLNCINLITRAYGGLIISKNEESDDFVIVEDLISRIPSEPERLSVWTEVAIIAYSNAREDISKKVFNDHILPLFQSCVDKKVDLESISNSFILLHIYNSELANEQLYQIPDEKREIIYSKICDYYLTKQSPFEAYDRDVVKYDCKYNDFIKVISVIGNMNTDMFIYTHVNYIYKALTNNKNNISKIQIKTIVSRLLEIVQKKLPDGKNIKHEGYRLISEVKLRLLNREGVTWGKFIEQSSNISNISDNIFVKSVLLENIPFDKIKDGITVKRKLVDEVIEGLDSFEIHYEFVQRVIDLSETMYSIDRNRWKKVVGKAFSLTNKLDEGKEIYISQKSIIDSMYRLDPTYAKELIKTIDTENSRNRINELILEHYESLELSQKIKNNLDLVQKERENYKLVVKSIYRALKSLNSDKITTKKIEEVSKYLMIGNKLPLHEVFPVYIFYLNNCSKKYRTKNPQGTVENIHRDNFKEIVNATNTIQILSQKRKNLDRVSRAFFIDKMFSENKPVKPNTREEAFNFIRDWMKKELTEFLYIVDPYFSESDIEILKVVKEINPNIDVEILGSRGGRDLDIEEKIKRHWKKISDEYPPYTNITFCWNPESSTQEPFHDRWIITKNSGLRLGTSINSLGIQRESELSIMKPNESFNILESTVKEYVNRRKKEINNQRLSYKSFSL